VDWIKGFFSKENAGWLTTAGAVVAGALSLGIFSGGGSIGIGSILGALAVGGTALIVSQVMTGSGVFHPDGSVANRIGAFVQKEYESKHLPGTPGLRFDEQIKAVLTEKEGVFIGEAHNRPGMVQAVTQILPQLKENGVRTLSLEMTQASIDQIMSATPQSFTPEGSKASGFRPEALSSVMAYQQLIAEAKRLDIKVLAHETPPVINATATVNAEGKVEVGNFEVQQETNLELFARHDDRNRYAADYINKNKVPGGKVIVVGGIDHSGDFSGGMMDKVKPSKGVDRLLGYASMDYEIANDGMPVGATVKTDGKFNDYTVRIPEGDLPAGTFIPAPVTPIATGRTNGSSVQENSR